MARIIVRGRVPLLFILGLSAARCGGGKSQSPSDAAGTGGLRDGAAGTGGTGGSTGGAAGDGPAGMSGGDAGDGPSFGDGSSEEGPTVIPTVTVDASLNNLTLDGCGVAAAVFADVPAGTYTIELAASTLSKGTAAGSPAVDDYVIVHLPLPPGDADEVHRFFMLHGVGATANVTLPAMGTIELMFIDSDSVSNNGQATLTLNPGGWTATVDATANVLSWNDGCHSTPATLRVTDVPHRATLVASSLSAGPGSADNFVILRLPLDGATAPSRYVILNGIGASQDFTPFNNLVLSAWSIGATAGATGEATISISDI